jgi:carbamoyltransferase
MWTLGWHGGPKRVFEDGSPGWTAHDGAAVLLRDGEVVAAIEEERLNRVKHSNFFPTEAIRFCLRQAGITFSDVARVAMNFEEEGGDRFVRDMVLDDPNVRFGGIRDAIRAVFFAEFGADVSDKLFFCHHHHAHVLSAFYPSGYDSTLILSVDGRGDGLSGMVAEADRDQVRVLGTYPVAHSLGDLYSDSIRYLGFKRFDEYKSMGLAPYGHPETYASLFEQFYRLLPEGRYELLPSESRWQIIHREGLIRHVRRKGDPFAQTHMDYAASLQQMLETIVFHVLDHFQQQTRQDTLCIVGGVGHNCTLNGKVLYDGRFRRVFVQPACHDAGGALGAAIAAYQDAGGKGRPQRLEHLYFGSDLRAEEVASALQRWRGFLSFEKVDRPGHAAAELIAAGEVLGWVQGRSEFGPRALGNRSILADPRPAENKSIINRMVKKRESFRPFAPSVCEERMAEFFETPAAEADLSFMIYVLRVRREMREKLGAITHVDGTARIQTVSKRTNPEYWELINEFGRLTGIPIVLNTSFNNNAEPIVDSAEDAIVCFLTTGLHALVMGAYVARKQELGPSDPVYRTLAPSLLQSRKLVRRMLPHDGAAGPTFAIETTASRYFCQTFTEISPDLYRVLLAADGRKTLAALGQEAGLDESAMDRLTREVVELWTARALVLRPPG